MLRPTTNNHEPSSISPMAELFLPFSPASSLRRCCSLHPTHSNVCVVKNRMEDFTPGNGIFSTATSCSREAKSILEQQHQDAVRQSGNPFLLLFPYDTTLRLVCEPCLFLLFIITLTIQNGKKVGGKRYVNLGREKEELS